MRAATGIDDMLPSIGLFRFVLLVPVETESRVDDSTTHRKETQ